MFGSGLEIVVLKKTKERSKPCTNIESWKQDTFK